MRRHLTGLTFGAALVVALLARGPAVLGIALLFLVFVPLEKLFALRRQRTFRPGLLTDLTHRLINGLITAIAVTVIVVAFAAVVPVPTASAVSGAASARLATAAATANHLLLMLPPGIELVCDSPRGTGCRRDDSLCLPADAWRRRTRSVGARRLEAWHDATIPLRPSACA